MDCGAEVTPWDMDHDATRGSRNGSKLSKEAKKTDSEEKMEQLERDEDGILRLDQMNQIPHEWEQWTRKEDEEKKYEKGKEPLQGERKAASERSWERLQAEVKKYDDGLVVGYKEDIDTLLVFAGLFSAVVTAFLIESYQWLSEDTTVIILTQISQQLDGTQTPSQSVPFKPEASSIRINCFWFLSLIFSLTSALFGLLCKQWLREHQRDVPTRMPGEDLALRQLRRDSFEKWGIASFLSALPILLEIALIFFFIGVLDLLWALQPLLFGICFTAIALSVGLYVLTTILPTITIPCDQEFIRTWDPAVQGYYCNFGQLAYQFVCPYKSPQAWAIYKLFPKPLLNIPFLDRFTKTHLRPLWDHIQAQATSWSAFDLRVVRQFDQEVFLSKLAPPFRLQIFELRALQWAVAIFRDSPSMIPHLENVLETLPRSVAISAALDRWDIMMWEVKKWDIGTYLRYPDHFPSMPKPITSDVPLHSQEGIEMLFWHRLWNIYAECHSHTILLGELEEFVKKFPKSSRNFQFFIPFPLATALWSHEDPWVRQQSLRLLQFFEDSWRPSIGYDEEKHDKERLAFANALARHICFSDRPSALLTSRRGQLFIRFIHNEMINRRFYRDLFVWTEWQNTIEKVVEVGQLPSDYFVPLPKRDDDSLLLELELPQDEPIRYSIGTVPSQFSLYQNEDEGRTPHADNADERIDIQVHGSCGNTTSGIPNLGASNSDNRGDSGLQATDENSALPPNNNEPAATTRTVAGGANHGDSKVQLTEGLAKGSLVPLSTEGDEPNVPRGIAPPNIDPDQATEDGAHTVFALSTGDESTRDDHGEHVVDDIGGPGSLRNQGVRGGDGGRGWNVINDPNHLRMHRFCP
ncbi:hypothetical protein VNI00_016310 [Paramarasmius palmivorus]|uniref:DUF6535 domain-containing protein n=1 Tax=Paramarasmius palmivorus TaxID=297713 RepID=A0AAW0BFZ3_9AGAR